MKNKSIDFVIHEKLENMTLVPLKGYTKKPAVSWGEYEGGIDRQDDTITGYAVHCGKSNIIVIDIDCKTREKNGNITWAKILERNDAEYPLTFTTRTPNDGTHLYFTIDDTLKLTNAKPKDWDYIDIRAGKGLIIAPGSKVKNDEGEIKEYEVIDNIDIAPLPEWLKKEIINNTKSKNKKAKTILTEEMTENFSGALDKAYNDLINTTTNRNDKLNSVSFWLGEIKVPKEQAWETMERAALEIGLEYEEIEKTFSSGYNSGYSLPKPENYNTNPNAIKITESTWKDPYDDWFYSEMGLALNYAEENMHRLCYQSKENSWYMYKELEGIWEEIDSSIIEQSVQNYILSIHDKYHNDNNVPKKMMSVFPKLRQTRIVDAVTKQLRNNLLINYSFDTDNVHIVVKNGVVDLRTGELKPFDRKLRSTKRVDVNYNPEKVDAMCDKVIESIAKEDQEYMQLMAGQSLTGYTPSSQVCFFLNGKGSNGKSTFIDLMHKTAGDYGGKPDTIALTSNKRGENYALAAFQGIRQAIIEELPDSKILDVGAIKRVVGTQDLTTRKIYKNPITFPVQATLWITCNSLPSVIEVDDGTWRRLKVVQFPYSYKSDESEIYDDSCKLADINVIFAAQNSDDTAEAFLAWRVKGAVKWFADKSKEMRTPDHIEEVSSEWRYSNDHILAYFKDEIIYDSDYVVIKEDLRKEFNRWIESRGHSPLSYKVFFDRLNHHAVYQKNGLTETVRQRIPAHYTQSFSSSYGIKRSDTKASFIKGMRFRTEED